MTASEKPVKEQANELPSTLSLDNSPTHKSESMEDALKLPGVFLLLSDAFAATWKLRIVIYGYVAWLLIPTIALLFADGLPSPYSDTLSLIASVLSLALGLWINAAIALYVGVVVTSEEGDTINFSILSQRAWDKVPGLFMIQALSGLAIMLGSLCLIIPGVIAWVWTALASQQYLLSSKGVIESLKMSRELTRGRFMPMLGRLLVANLCLSGLIVLAFGLYVLAGLHGSATLLIPTLQAWPGWLEAGFSLISLPLIPVSAIFNIMLYFAVKRTYSLSETLKEKMTS